MSDELYWCQTCEKVCVADGMHVCGEVWCRQCAVYHAEDMDCPFIGGVRVIPERSTKRPAGKLPLWLAFLIIASSGIGTVLIVRFAAWLGSR